MEPQYRLSVRIAAILIVVLAALLLLEGASRLVLDDPNARQHSLSSEIRNRLNNPAENDSKLPLYLSNQGGDCVRQDTSRLRWHPRFGYHSKTLDIECARRLFSSGAPKILTFGGSTMANVGMVNYLTSLDYLAFGATPEWRSINLAEPGTRHSNGLARFIEEGIPLRPDVAIFLDGNNEFLSIRHGGNPGDDAHWTVGVNNRVHAPLWGLADRAVHLSRFAEIALIGTGLFPSARRVLQSVELSKVDNDVEHYLRARAITEALCRSYSVRCFFLLQPLAVLVPNPTGSTKTIVDQQLRFFPFDKEIYTHGYGLIRQAAKTKDHIDTTGLFERSDDAFIDSVHLSKVGSATLARVMREAVMSSPPPPSQRH